MSLYSKYRSQTFDDLIEQDSIKTILKNQILKINSWEIKLSNYIFSGPRWIGKTSVARIFAKAINCLNNKDGNPCNVCEACISITNNRTLDVVEIDAASHTGVDNVREEIIAKSIYPPNNLRKKIYIIDEAHMLTKSAFNALLKIIEEPPDYLVFIFATTDSQKILETVKSRCQLFWFKNISVEWIVWRLKYVCQQENIQYDDKWLYLIAKTSNGWMRDALKYLDQVSWIWDATEDIVTKTLWITNDTILQDFINVYKKNNLLDINNWIDNLVESGYDIWNFIKDLAQLLDKSMTISNLSDSMSLFQIIRWYFDNVKNYPYPITILKYQILLSLSESSNNLDLKNKENILTIDDNKKSVEFKNDVNNTNPITQNLETKTLWNIDQKTDLSSIKQYIIDNSGTTVKNIWSKSCDIIWIDNNILTVWVISQWSLNILETKKSDTQNLAKEIIGQDISIIYKVISSEDLLQNISDWNGW